MVGIEWIIYHWEVEKISLTTPQGIISLLPGHINLASSLEKGKISYVVSDDNKTSLESFNDNVTTLHIDWWLVVLEDDVITVTIE